MGKKKIKPGSIDPDVVGCSLHVNYTEEVTDDATGDVTKSRKVYDTSLPAPDH